MSINHTRLTHTKCVMWLPITLASVYLSLPVTLALPVYLSIPQAAPCSLPVYLSIPQAAPLSLPGGLACVRVTSPFPVAVPM